MRICVISSTIFKCPPDGYAGLEQLAYQQTVGLADKGHKVTLIAPKESTVPDNVSLHGTTLGEPERRAYGGYVQKLKDFDCIIDNSWQKWAYQQHDTPVLGVLHAPVHTMYQVAPPVQKPCLICISKDQGEAAKELLKCEVRVAYNGVDVDSYKPTGRVRNMRYLFLARMSSIKGPDIAIDVAKKCQVPIDMVGDDKVTGEPALADMVKEHCIRTPSARYIGNQSRKQCAVWFNANYALLHPNLRFREPFGLAPVEAQLCGMPVIAWNNGAMRETIKQGETGFLVNSQEGLEMLLQDNAVSMIKAKDCREWASQFSYQNMVNRYEELCEEALNEGW